MVPSRREVLVAAVIASLGAVVIAITYTQSRSKEARDIETSFLDVAGEESEAARRAFEQTALGGNFGWLVCRSGAGAGPVTLPRLALVYT